MMMKTSWIVPITRAAQNTYALVVAHLEGADVEDEDAGWEKVLAKHRALVNL